MASIQAFGMYKCMGTLSQLPGDDAVAHQAGQLYSVNGLAHWCGIARRACTAPTSLLSCCVLAHAMQACTYTTYTAGAYARACMAVRHASRYENTQLQYAIPVRGVHVHVNPTEGPIGQSQEQAEGLHY